VDKRLFLPEPWFGEDYVERRHKCPVPEELRCHTKPQWAAEMVMAIRGEGRLPFKYVVAAWLYGNSPDFLDAIAACVGVTALVSIPSDTRGGLQRPGTTETTYTYKGAMRSQRVVAPEGAAPLTGAALAPPLPSSGWYRRRGSEGSKGPLAYAVARKRVPLCKNDLPARTVWLVIQRTLGAHPTDAFYLSNAPASAPLRLCVWLSGLRWAVEQSFEETKTALGRAHYEVRKYPGWHRPMLTSMLAHFFLWPLKLRLGKKSTGADGGAGAGVIGSGLTPAPVDDCRRFGVRGVGPKAPSPGLWGPPQTMARGWIRALQAHGVRPRYFL
jgi:SRSO17 transposase